MSNGTSLASTSSRFVPRRMRWVTEPWKPRNKWLEISWGGDVHESEERWLHVSVNKFLKWLEILDKQWMFRYTNMCVDAHNGRPRKD